MEQGRGARFGSETTRFEETRAKVRHAWEGYHEFAWFVSPPSVSARLTVDKLSTPVKSSDSQREEWKLTDEEVISQVR